MPTNDTKLTEEQHRLILDNMKLCYSILKTHHKFVKLVGYEEAESFATLVFCFAVRTFNPAKGKLSTHFYRAFHFQIKRYLARFYRAGQFQEIPEALAVTLFAVGEDGDEEVIERMAFSRLSPRELKAIQLRYGIDCVARGSDRSIASHMGLKRKAVTAARHRAMKKLREYYGLPRNQSGDHRGYQPGFDRGQPGRAASWDVAEGSATPATLGQ